MILNAKNLHWESVFIFNLHFNSSLTTNVINEHHGRRYVGVKSMYQVIILHIQVEVEFTGCFCAFISSNVCALSCRWFVSVCVFVGVGVCGRLQNMGEGMMVN